jgi:thioesterase domain-containing protein
MARFHLRAIRAHQPSGPYLLGGTCNGGLVAYEIARRLSHEGERVDALVLIAASAGNLRLKYLRRWVAPLRIFSKRAERRVFARLNPFWMAMTLLPLSQRPSFVLSKLPRLFELLRGSTLGTKETLAERSLDASAQRDSFSGAALRAQIADTYHRIDREYWPGPYRGKVTLFCWDGEPEGPAEMARWWSQIAAQVELHTFHGKWHGDSLTGQAEAVGERLRVCLDSARCG